MLVDFHTHLDWYPNSEELFTQLQNFSGIIVTSSVDVESFKKNLEIEKSCKHENLKIIPTFGVHPERAEKYADNLSILDEYLEKSEFIGEIGLDFYWAKNVSKTAQEKVFRYILEHCNKTEKYCVIHTKGAEKEIADILTEYPKAKPIIHWYSGPESIYQEFIKRGYLQTFGCETIRNQKLQEFLKITPKELILVETDNPTAEPWLGGTDSSVNLIGKIYKDLAQILFITNEEMKKLVFENVQGILKQINL